jgi:TPR repeat protein
MIKCIFMVLTVLIVPEKLDAKPHSQNVTSAEIIKSSGDSEEAITKRKLEESAKRGSPVAMYQFAKYGQPESVKMEWFKKAAAKGYGPAVLELSAKAEPDMLDKNLSSTEKSQKYKEYQYAMSQAFQALVLWSEKGDLESMFRIGAASGVFEKEGIATEQECLPWLRKAADLGHEVAPFELALKLIRMGTPSEKTEGFEWLKRSTKKGNCRYQAAAKLVHYYTYGFPEIELKRNAKEAWKWVRKGAELEGCNVGEFLAENGLQDPNKVKPGEILFQ